MSRPRLVVVGSSNTDMTVLSQRLPQAGETVTGGTFLEAGGGKGANQAVAAARAGAEVTFVGRVGDDRFGEAAIQRLRDEGIDTDLITVDSRAASGVALIMVDASGENVISVALGANARLSADDVRRAQGAVESADALLVQLEIPMDAVEAALDIARSAGAHTVMDPAPVPDAGLRPELLSKVSVLTPNAPEARRLAGGPDRKPGACARRLLELGAGAVAVTLGGDGVLLCDADGCASVPAAPAAPVDTVGAGDCFAATLTVALAEGKSLMEAARFAVCAAALATQVEGAQPSLPRRDEIEIKLAETFGHA